METLSILNKMIMILKMLSCPQKRREAEGKETIYSAYLLRIAQGISTRDASFI